MISVEEALMRVAAQRRDLGDETITLHAAARRILAQDVHADRDFPAYDRITMDGISLATQDWQNGQRAFPIAGMQAAGRPAQVLHDAQTCLEVATGAVLPAGTDAVVPYEECSISGGIAHITADAVRVGQNIHRQGTDSAAGSLLLSRHTSITPGASAVLATVGAARVAVRRLPRVAICATGDELVAIDAAPAPHQIRSSNSAMLAAALHQDGLSADLYHLPDVPAEMTERLAALRSEYDAVLLSGAVSKGAFDFLPGVLQKLGLETHFHRIAQRPGKPMLFGSFPAGPVVFGFPGNPVSTLVCYALYFRHWLHQSLGCTPASCSARLTTDVRFQPALTYHLLVHAAVRDGMLEATPCAGANSGDLVSLSAANALLTLPAHMQQFTPGESYPLTILAPFF